MSDTLILTALIFTVLRLALDISRALRHPLVWAGEWEDQS